jgi:hypothetical protein
MGLVLPFRDGPATHAAGETAGLTRLQAAADVQYSRASHGSIPRRQEHHAAGGSANSPALSRWREAAVAEQFGLSASTIGFIVARHPRVAQLVKRGVRLSDIAVRFRLEFSTVQRIAGQKVKRNRVRPWG